MEATSLSSSTPLASIGLLNEPRCAQRRYDVLRDRQGEANYSALAGVRLLDQARDVLTARGPPRIGRTDRLRPSRLDQI